MEDDTFRRPLPVEDHPASELGYVLATAPIDEGYQHIKRCIRTRVPGSIIFAITRYGKTYFIRYAQQQIALDFPGIVTMSFGCIQSVASEGNFFSLLLIAVGHPSPLTGSVIARRLRLINKLVDMLVQSKQSRLVIFADEAQKLERDQYEWLREVHDALEKKGFRTTTFLVGQPKLMHKKSALKRSGDYQIVARFMIEECEFRGLRSLSDIQRCLEGYDTSFYPENSDWSFTRFFLPKAWARGFRLKSSSVFLWNTFCTMFKELGLPGNEIEIPTSYLTKSVELAFLNIALELDDPDFKFSSEHWKQSVEQAKYVVAQEELLNKLSPDD